jgi:hypothetical protein
MECMMTIEKFAAPAALMFALIQGCSDGADTTTTDSVKFESPSELQQALEAPIVDCQASARTCLGDATDVAAAQACNKGFSECLQNAATQGESIAQQVETCRQDAYDCLPTGDAISCQTTYASCARSALGAAGDGGLALPSGLTLDGGVSSLPSLPSGGSSSNGPTLPSLPSGGSLSGLSDGGLDNLPTPLRCTIELRLCLYKDPSAATECGDAARACLKLP